MVLKQVMRYDFMVFATSSIKYKHHPTAQTADASKAYHILTSFFHEKDLHYAFPSDYCCSRSALRKCTSIRLSRCHCVGHQCCERISARVLAIFDTIDRHVRTWCCWQPEVRLQRQQCFVHYHSTQIQCHQTQQPYSPSNDVSRNSTAVLLLTSIACRVHIWLGTHLVTFI